MEKTMIIIVVLLIIGFIGLCLYGQHIVDTSSMNAFALTKGTTLTTYEHRTFSIGPYWYVPKGARVYRLVLSNGRIFYMRTGVFANEFLEWHE